MINTLQIFIPAERPYRFIRESKLVSKSWYNEIDITDSGV